MLQNQTEPVAHEKPVDISITIEDFEDRFRNLQKEILHQLVVSDIDTSTLINSITLLPTKLKEEYQTAMKELLPSLSKEKTIQELFFHLNFLISFIDYGLLEHIIRLFGCDNLKKDMMSYCDDMQVFMKKTTIKELIGCLPGRKKALPNFDVLKAKIGKDTSKCTLHQINTLRKRFCAEVKLSEVVFCLIALEDSNSFIISWLVPSVLVHDLMESAREIEEIFFDIENVVSLSIGNRWQYNPKLIPFNSKLRQQYQQFQVSPSPVEWIPSPTKKVFRLAMIQRERLRQRHIEDELAYMTISDRVDEILLQGRPLLELEHIFRNTLRGSEIILIEGAPGSGKSTLAVHICQRWGKGELFQQFTVVILVQLRDPAVQRAQTIADLLPIENVAIAQEVATELIATNGCGVLWVLDGWDELPAHLQKYSIFHSFLPPNYVFHSVIKEKLMHYAYEDRLLNKCSVVITSRPISSGDLHPVVSSRIEVLGFTPEEQRQYFTECIKGDTVALEALLEKIQENPVVQSICHLPLNAAFIAYIFKYKNQLLPNTEYDIYLSIILNCIQCHFERESRGYFLPIELASLDDLSKSKVVREPFQHLCELAYRGMMENKVTFSCSDLPQGSNTLGLLQAIESFLQSGKSVFYSFLHLSIQEVLSAYYIATYLSDSEQVSQFQQLFNKPRFAAVFQFYSAITKLKSLGICQVIARIVEAKSKPLFMFLLRCLHEAQNPSLCLYVAERLEFELNLSRTSLGQLNCLSISFFLSSVTSKKISVNLNGCSIGDLGAKSLAKYNMGCYVDHVSKVGICLEGNKIQEGASYIARMLYNFMQVYLSHNPIGNTGVSLMSEAIRECTTLETLGLYNCSITSRGAESLSSALAQNHSLEKLDIGRNNLGDEGISHLAEALKLNTQLKELWISECRMTDKGAASLAGALSVNNSLKMLYMSGVKGALTEDGLATITQSLANNPEFVKLAISYQFDSTTSRFRWKANEARKRNGLQPIEIEGEYCISCVGVLHQIKALLP